MSDRKGIDWQAEIQRRSEKRTACGAETISFGPDGAQYGSDDRGIIWKADAGSSKARPVAFVGGRPLGHMPDGKGNLIMADACKVMLCPRKQDGSHSSNMSSLKPQA